MKDSICPTENKLNHGPIRICALYAALALAIDETETPIIAAHWDAPTRKQILDQIAMAEGDLGIPANDNVKAKCPEAVAHD